jgi:hypothetical protein
LWTISHKVRLSVPESPTVRVTITPTLAVLAPFKEGIVIELIIGKYLTIKDLIEELAASMTETILD